MKKLISFLVVLCLLLSTMVPALAAEATLSLTVKLSQTEVKPGATVGYKVSVAEGNTPAAYQEVVIFAKDASGNCAYAAQAVTESNGSVSGNFKLAPKAPGGNYVFVVSTSDGSGKNISKETPFKVKGGMLNPNLKTDKVTYYPGDVVKVTGQSNGSGDMGGSDVMVSLYKGDELVYVNQIQADDSGAFAFEYPIAKRWGVKGDYTWTVSAGGDDMKASFKVIPYSQDQSGDDILYQLKAKGLVSNTVNNKQVLSQTLFFDTMAKIFNVTVKEGQTSQTALQTAGVLTNAKLTSTGKLTVNEMINCFVDFYANAKKVKITDATFSFDRTIQSKSELKFLATDALMVYYNNYSLDGSRDAKVADFIVVLYTLFMQS